MEIDNRCRPLVMAAKIKYYNDGSDFRLPNRGKVTGWLKGVVESESMHLGAVNFIFCSPERQIEINRQFLKHDYRTDVITFDYSDDKQISGDIFIDPETVEDNAKELSVAVNMEMRRVMAHGILHLCGYGDKTRREQKQMRAKENYYLAKFYEIV